MAKQTVSKVKKKVWTAFSCFIRTRDCLRTTGCASFGLCITCGKRYHFKLLQAGHFIAGRYNAGLFDEQGVHAQCYNCNINLKGNILEYRRQIIKLYGERIDEVLEKRSQEIRQYKIPELLELESKFKILTKELLKQITVCRALKR